MAGNKRLPFAEVNARALPILHSLLGRWLPDGVVRGNRYYARNPTRADKSIGSFSIDLFTGRWADFATGDKGGDVISLAAYLFNLTQKEALRFVNKAMEENHD